MDASPFAAAFTSEPFWLLSWRGLGDLLNAKEFGKWVNDWQKLLTLAPISK